MVIFSMIFNRIKADIDGDNKVSFEEFMVMMQGT